MLQSNGKNYGYDRDIKRRQCSCCKEEFDLVVGFYRKNGDKVKTSNLTCGRNESKLETECFVIDGEPYDLTFYKCPWCGMVHFTSAAKHECEPSKRIANKLTGKKLLVDFGTVETELVFDDDKCRM